MTCDAADKRKLTSTEKECIAVLSGIEAYRQHKVHGKFTVVTDHNALVWLHTAKHTGRLERWALQLKEYCFQMLHRSTVGRMLLEDDLIKTQSE